MDPRSYLYAYSFYEDPTPYFNSLKNDPNAVVGLAASSVYGGNTPNSEFEFLTGITIGYMPNGAVPYMQYVDDPQYSLAWAMKDGLLYHRDAPLLFERLEQDECLSEPRIRQDDVHG